MARKIAVLVALIATVFIVGCSGADPAKAAVGTWKMDMDTSAMPEKEKAIADAMKGMYSAISLEIKEGGVATMSAMGQSNDGTWKVEGNKITISGPSGMGNGKDLVGTISGDGKTITIEATKEEQDKMKGAKLTLVKQEAAK